MNEVRLVTPDEVWHGQYQCLTCNQEADVYFVNAKVVTAVRCPCGGTCTLRGEPELTAEKVEWLGIPV